VALCLSVGTYLDGGSDRVIFASLATYFFFNSEKEVSKKTPPQLLSFAL